ncbi:MAG: hypothetical protein SFU91_04610 [Chloroherpetonaceae bacterium]|nr:hypothetical protein [Chloroherpetonaceae bacterium]
MRRVRAAVGNRFRFSFIMGEIKTFSVKSQDDLWFYEKQINLFDILEFFPFDAIGNGEKEGKLIKIETDLGWSFETDIERGKFCFRKKSKSQPGTGKWVVESGLKAGDQIALEKLGEYHFRLYKINAV